MTDWTKDEAIGFLEGLSDEQLDAVIAKGTPAQVDVILSAISARDEAGPEFVELAEAGDVYHDIDQTHTRLVNVIGRQPTQRERDAMTPYLQQQRAGGESPDLLAAWERVQADPNWKAPTRRERMADAVESANPPAELGEPPEKPEGASREQMREWRRDYIAWAHEAGGSEGAMAATFSRTPEPEEVEAT